MEAGPAGSSARQIQTLWASGVLGNADDTTLLALFCDERGRAADAAFRVLVERHGPMVLRICRQVLGDPHDGNDAAQAVFLVLARKAGSIRDRGSLASWLHSVARRVASRARRRLALHRASESRAVAARGQAIATVSTPAPDWEAIHDEVARLPEKYRAPIVLCYLEGQTYEETAQRLGCPVGTVRVRLSRARDRLRDRLRRRGFGLVPFVPENASETCPSAWVESTVRASRSFIGGRAAEAGAVSASALALSQGVLWTMTMTRFKLAACGLLAISGLAAGGTVLVGQEPTPAGVETKAPSPPPAPDRERELALRIATAARQRLEAQRAFYEEGRITLDRYVDASRHVMGAETRLALSRDERVNAARAHLERVTAILRREQAELKQGRGTPADVTEAQQAQVEAELDVFDATRSGGPSDLQALERRLGVMERKLDQVVRRIEILPSAHGR